MRSFKLLNGFHHENGIEYRPGQIVKSERNLCAKFKNKFEALAETAVPPVLKAVVAPAGAPVAVVDPAVKPGDAEPEKLGPPEPEVEPATVIRRRRN